MRKNKGHCKTWKLTLESPSDPTPERAMGRRASRAHAGIEDSDYDFIPGSAQQWLAGEVEVVRMCPNLSLTPPLFSFLPSHWLIGKKNLKPRRSLIEAINAPFLRQRCRGILDLRDKTAYDMTSHMVVNTCHPRTPETEARMGYIERVFLFVFVFQNTKPE